jgi:hypothetical protein
VQIGDAHNFISWMCRSLDPTLVLRLAAALLPMYITLYYITLHYITSHLVVLRLAAAALRGQHGALAALAAPPRLDRERRRSRGRLGVRRLERAALLEPPLQLGLRPLLLSCEATSSFSAMSSLTNAPSLACDRLLLSVEISGAILLRHVLANKRASRVAACCACAISTSDISGPIASIRAWWQKRRLRRGVGLFA